MYNVQSVFNDVFEEDDYCFSWLWMKLKALAGTKGARYYTSFKNGMSLKNVLYEQRVKQRREASNGCEKNEKW